MRRVIFLLMISISVLALSSGVYVETAEATGNTFDEAKDKAVKVALLRIARYVSTEIAETTLREVKYDEKGMKEKFFQRVMTRTDVIIENYDVEVLSKEEKKGYYKVKVRVSVPKDILRESLERMSILSLVEVLHDSGYLSRALSIMESEKEKFESPLWQKRFSSLHLKIMDEIRDLRMKLEEAETKKSSGKILSYLTEVSDVLKRWKDVPNFERIIEEVRNVSKSVSVELGELPKDLVVLRKSRIEINLKVNGKTVEDHALIDVVTPDGVEKLHFDGATVTVDISPQYLRKEYNVRISVAGLVDKTLSFPTRIMEERNDIEGCVMRTTFPSFTDLPVGKKTKMAIIAPPKTWFYLFDYNDSKKTLKLLLKRRMTNKGSFVLSFYFDEPTGDFYEGILVVFSEEDIPTLKEGFSYQLRTLRKKINELDGISTKEVIYRVIEE